MHYSSMTIDLMSGTGNSFRAASWMGEIARNNEMRSDLCQISKHHKNNNLPEKSDDLLGVVFPTHGFTAPWHVIRHVLHLPYVRGKHAFVVATRAGIRIASFPVPGMEGTAGYLIALILILKGYTVRGVMGLDMPSNWMSLHWGLNLKNSNYIIDRARIKTTLFMNSILQGKRVFKGIIPLLLGLILMPLSLGYLVIGRFFLAKLFFASGSCTGCGLCSASCPMKAIKMVGRKNPRPYWTFSCESCMRCMGYCPAEAVEASHSFGIILYYLTTLPVSVYILNGLSTIIFMGKVIPIVNIILNYAYTLISIYLAYLFLFWIIKIPMFNKLFTYTTFTHYYRRYHEPSTKLKDIVGKD